MPEHGLWQAGSLEASYKRLKAWFNSKRVYMKLQSGIEEVIIRKSDLVVDARLESLLK